MLLKFLLSLIPLALAEWPENACTSKDTESSTCQGLCDYKTCATDHWCSCGSCLPLSYCLTLCNYVGCGGAEQGLAIEGMCCECGYCFKTADSGGDAAEEDTEALEALKSGRKLNSPGGWGTLADQGRFEEMRDMGIDVEGEKLTTFYPRPSDSKVGSSSNTAGQTAALVMIPIGVMTVLLLGAFLFWRVKVQKGMSGTPLEAHDRSPLSPNTGLRMSKNQLKQAYQAGGIANVEL